MIRHDIQLPRPLGFIFPRLSLQSSINRQVAAAEISTSRPKAVATEVRKMDPERRGARKQDRCHACYESLLMRKNENRKKFNAKHMS